MKQEQIDTLINLLKEVSQEKEHFVPRMKAKINKAIEILEKEINK